MKKTILLLFVFSLFTLHNCASGLEEIISESYADGTPKVVKYYEGEGKEKTMVKEATYYPDGKLRMEGEYHQGLKDGKWVSFYPNGNPWSEGNYVQGVNDGQTITWHENGQKYYEGFYKNNQRAGLWKFWNEAGELIKEIDYNNLGE